MQSVWCHKKRVNAKRPNCYSSNALPVPTPVLTGSGSLGPSLKRSQAVKPPQGVLILQSSAHYTMKFRNPLVLARGMNQKGQHRCQPYILVAQTGIEPVTRGFSRRKLKIKFIKSIACNARKLYS